MVFREVLRGNIRVLAIRDILLLTSSGLNGGLTIIYCMSVLGADAIAIGALGSVEAIVGTCFTLIGGWMGDTYDRKKMFLVGTGITMFSPLVLALAPSWQYLIIAYITGSIGGAIVDPIGFSIRATSVERSLLTKTTATLYTIRELINMVVPPIGSALIALSGSLQSLRMIYAIEACVNLFVWLYVAEKLKVPEPNNETSGNEPNNDPRPSLRSFVRDCIDTYQISRRAGTWLFLLLAVTGPWTANIDINFQTVYANSICQSPLIVIGLLSTISSLVHILLFIPIAKLAEKRGRTNVVLMIRPIRYLGDLIYILAGTFFIPGITPYIPLLVWGLRASGGAGGPGLEVASIEGVPSGRLSTWVALQSFVFRLVGIPAPLVGSVLWNIDPRAPFIWHLGADALIRLRVLRKIAKTQKVPEN